MSIEVKFVIMAEIWTNLARFVKIWLRSPYIGGEIV